MTLFEYFEHIRKRPQMYFEEPLTFAHIDSFFLGFQSAHNQKEIFASNGMSIQYFNSWLTGALKEKTLPENKGWRKRIEYLYQNETQALEVFFDLIFKFANGKVDITPINTEPISLNWSRGDAHNKFEDFQKIEETIVRFEIMKHEFSKTTFKIGYNANDFRVYVEPKLQGKHLRAFRYTEIEKQY
jgi:hypothetical protein